MDKKYKNVLLKSAIFSDIEPKTVEDFLQNNGQFCTLKTNGENNDENIYKKRLGFVLSGMIEVHTLSANQQLMRILRSGDIFGLVTPFCEQSEISTLRPIKESVVYCLSQDEITTLFAVCPQFLTNYIEQMSKRIVYLNEKVNYLSCANGTQRVALWILNHKEDSFETEENLSDVSLLLNMGRASLYRAFNALIEEGCIEKNGKLVDILSRRLLKNKINSNSNN